MWRHIQGIYCWCGATSGLLLHTWKDIEMLVLSCWMFEAGADKYSKGDVAEPYKLYKWNTFLSKNYLYSFKKVEPKNLIVTDIERFVGDILSLTKVVGIVDLSESHIPFFVRESAIPAIEKRINETKTYEVI